MWTGTNWRVWDKKWAVCCVYTVSIRYEGTCLHLYELDPRPRHYKQPVQGCVTFGGWFTELNPTWKSQYQFITLLCRTTVESRNKWWSVGTFCHPPSLSLCDTRQWWWPRFDLWPRGTSWARRVNCCLRFSTGAQSIHPPSHPYARIWHGTLGSNTLSRNFLWVKDDPVLVRCLVER